MNRKAIRNGIILLFVGIFLYTAISKCLAFTTFTLELKESPLLKNAAGLIAWLLPPLELGVAALLLLPAWRLTGLYLSCILMCLFTGYLITLSGYDDIPCSCGGILETMPHAAHVLLNITLISIAAAGICLEQKILRYAPPLQP
jgi:hypothetical protein